MTDEMNRWELVACAAILCALTCLLALLVGAVARDVIPNIDKIAPLYHLAQGVWP